MYFASPAAVDGPSGRPQAGPEPIGYPQTLATPGRDNDVAFGPFGPRSSNSSAPGLLPPWPVVPWYERVVCQRTREALAWL